MSRKADVGRWRKLCRLGAVPSWGLLATVTCGCDDLSLGGTISLGDGSGGGAGSAGGNGASTDSHAGATASEMGAATTTGTAGAGSGGTEAMGAASSSAGAIGFDVDDEDPSTNGDGGAGEACAVARAEATLVREPVDIVLALDNSGSMDEELEAVEQNINVNFANILAASEVDYRVILVSRHRVEARDAGSVPSTSVCVASPLAGQRECPTARPVFSERFFHYSTKIESDDSFDVLLGTFAPPFADAELEDKYDQAPMGWSAWLRPEAKKVFLELTDDDEDMPVEDFVRLLTDASPQHFGTPEAPTFVWHSICGVEEKEIATDPYLPEEAIVEGKCSGNGGDVTSAGVTYQVLSALTGGLRFPICQWTAYDTVFQTIADDVVVHRSVACDFEIPDAPGGKTIDLDKVAVRYTSGVDGSAVQLGQAPTVDDCQADAFYIDSARIHLCPGACETVRSDPQAEVDVLFTCESTLIVLR